MKFFFVPESTEADTSFKELRTQLYQFDCDFEKLCRIQNIVLSLYGQYQVSGNNGYMYVMTQVYLYRVSRLKKYIIAFE